MLLNRAVQGAGERIKLIRCDEIRNRRAENRGTEKFVGKFKVEEVRLNEDIKSD